MEKGATKLCVCERGDGGGGANCVVILKEARGWGKQVSG